VDQWLEHFIARLNFREHDDIGEARELEFFLLLVCFENIYRPVSCDGRVSHEPAIRGLIQCL